jgi:hypothetical protein
LLIRGWRSLRRQRVWFLSSAEHNDATAFDREIIRRSRRVMAESDKLVVASMKRIAESQT